jgi:SAM domain (Sterile alpha motif)
MQQAADWLQKLGLGQYAQSFAENDIDFAVLTDLTDQDLEKIGVTSLGHRRKLLRAIVDLSRVEDGAVKPISAPAAPVAHMIRPSADKSPSCSQTWWAQRRFRRAWTRRFCAKFQPTRGTSRRPSGASAASWRSTSAMGSRCISSRNGPPRGE